MPIVTDTKTLPPPTEEELHELRELVSGRYSKLQQPELDYIILALIEDHARLSAQVEALSAPLYDRSMDPYD